MRVKEAYQGYSRSATLPGPAKRIPEIPHIVKGRVSWTSPPHYIIYEEEVSMKQIALTVIVFYLCTTASPMAQTESQASAQFLLIAPGARSGGMGKAFTAVANDGTGEYYNPAGIIGTKYVSGEVFYTYWLPALADDLRYIYASGVINTNNLLPCKFGALGASFTMLSLGTQIHTDEYGEVLGVFSSHDWALTVSYANLVARSLAAGVNLKVIRSHLADVRAGREEEKGIGTSLVIDVGVLRQRILPRLTYSYRFLEPGVLPSKYLSKRIPPGVSLGLTLSNIGPKIMYTDHADMLPQNFRFGIAYNCIDTDVLGVMFAFDVYKPLISNREDPAYKTLFTAWSDQSFSDEIWDIDFHGGVEATLFYLITLRAGYSIDRDGDLKYGMFGFGLGPETFRFNFARDFAKETALQGEKYYSLLSVSF